MCVLAATLYTPITIIRAWCAVRQSVYMYNVHRSKTRLTKTVSNVNKPHPSLKINAYLCMYTVKERGDKVHIIMREVWMIEQGRSPRALQAQQK